MATSDVFDKLFFALGGAGALLCLGSMGLCVWAMSLPALPWWVGGIPLMGTILVMAGLIFSGNSKIGEILVGMVLCCAMPAIGITMLSVAAKVSLGEVSPGLDVMVMGALMGSGVLFASFVVLMMASSSR